MNEAFIKQTKEQLSLLYAELNLEKDEKKKELIQARINDLSLKLEGAEDEAAYWDWQTY